MIRYSLRMINSFLMKVLIKSHYLQMDIVAVDLDKIDLDEDINFGEDDPDTIILVRLLVW